MTFVLAKQNLNFESQYHSIKICGTQAFRRTKRICLKCLRCVLERDCTLRTPRLVSINTCHTRHRKDSDILRQTSCFSSYLMKL